MKQEVAEMDKAIKCLELELSSDVWNDVNEKWQNVKKALNSELVDVMNDADDDVRRMTESFMSKQQEKRLGINLHQKGDKNAISKNS